MDEFNLPNQHTRSASHTRACADAGRKRSASRQSEIRTNVADVDDVEGLLRLPGLGLLDQVAARLILAGLQRVLLFLRLGVVVRPQLCHLPSRQLKLPTQRDKNGEPSASGNSSSLPPPIRSPQRSLFRSTPAACSAKDAQGCSRSDTPVRLRTRAATPDPSRTPRHRAHHRCKSSILSQLRSVRRHSAHSFALSWQYCRHSPLEPVSDYRLKLLPSQIRKK